MSTTRKPRRTKEEIACDKAEKAARREAREQQRRERNAAASERASARYGAEMARVAKRDQQRRLQEDGVDFIEGRDTEGARRFAALVEQRLVAVKRSRGDVPQEVQTVVRRVGKRKKEITLPKFGSEGRFEIGERTVPDPLEAGNRMAAKVNVRESAIDHMASRGRINTAQEEAGQRFRKLWEMAAVGRKQGIDPAKEFVDGGGITDPISDELVKASIELNRVMGVAGQTGAKLLVAIVGEGKRIEDVAKNWSKAGGIVTGRRAEGYVVARMIEALDDLVRHWGLESKSRLTPCEQHYKRNGVTVPVVDRPIRQSSEGHTGPVVEIEVGRFGDVLETSKRPSDMRQHLQKSGTA